jgi:hypothetical protein
MRGKHRRPVQLGDGFHNIGQYLRAEDPTTCRHRIGCRTSQVARVAVEATNDCALHSSRSCRLIGKDKANG